METTQSYEDYLERILMIEEEKGTVKCIDIANKLNFTRSSVSIAIRKLYNDGYIDVDRKRGHIILLTPKGREVATNIYAKHKILKDFFMKLGVSEEIAEYDACRIEHDVSDETFEKFKEFLKNE